MGIFLGGLFLVSGLRVLSQNFSIGENGGRVRK